MGACTRVRGWSFIYYWGRDSVVGITTCNGLGGTRLQPQWRQGNFFRLYTRSDTLWGPPLFLLNGCGRSFLESKSRQRVMLTTHLHLARRWRRSGVVPHLLLYAFMELTLTILCSLYCIWVIPRFLNFICRRFGPLSSVSVDVAYTIKFRSRGITQKKQYNIQNTAKVWNQEFYIYMLYLY
jgi:hypothetical protein